MDPQAFLRMAAEAAPGAPGTPMQSAAGSRSLDEIAAGGIPGETVEEALQAFFPDALQSSLLVVAQFPEHEGAVSRLGVLAILRTRQGEAVLQKAQASALNLMEVAVLESLVAQCVSTGWQMPPQDAWSATPPWLLPGWTVKPPEEDEKPVDFGIVGPYLDQVKLGEPSKAGIPSGKVFKSAEAAAKHHTVPYADNIPASSFPKEWADRPLSAYEKQ